MEPIIRFDHVSKSFGKQAVLPDLSLDIAPGEFLTIIGRSGCGKTTALRLVNGLLTPDKGRVLVQGQDVSKADPVALRRGIGYAIVRRLGRDGFRVVVSATGPQEKYEQAVSNQTSGNRQNQSSVDSAKTAVEQAETNRTKQIKEAQKQVKEAKENLDNCAVTAPVSGTVTSLSVEEGDTYSGGTLLQIQDTQSFVITTSVDEYDISDVKVGQRVVILTDATDNDELEGKVTFVAPSTDSSGSTSTEAQGQSSGTTASSSDGYEVKIKVTSSDDRIKLGMTAKCSIVKKEASDTIRCGTQGKWRKLYFGQRWGFYLKSDRNNRNGDRLLY